MAPSPVSVSRSVIGSLAAVPYVAMVPAVMLAWRTDKVLNAAWFTEVKSAGGPSVSARIAVQSCLPQSARDAPALSGATISVMARTAGGRYRRGGLMPSKGTHPRIAPDG